MPYQAMSQLVATVSVCCEVCDNSYTYEHIFKTYGRSQTQVGARALADQNREGVLNWQTKRVAAGNISAFSDYKPCPKCGYVQSWMVEPVRRRRGWQWGLGVGFVSFLLMIPVAFLLNAILSGSPMGSAMAGVAFLLVYIVPIIVLFVARAIARRSFQPNKKHAAPAKLNKPSVDFHKKLEIGAQFTL
jgi:hypothetical protein